MIIHNIFNFVFILHSVSSDDREGCYYFLWNFLFKKKEIKNKYIILTRKKKPKTLLKI